MVWMAQDRTRSGPARPGRTGGGRLAAAFFAALLIGISAAPVTPVVAGDIAIEEVQVTNSRFVRIGLNKSVVIRLPANARDVLVGNPDIVDAVIRTKSTAYLFARAVGQTNVFFFDENGRQILGLDLEVAQDMAALQHLIQRTLPGSRIVVDTVGENVVLSGTAANPGEAKTAMDLAVKFAGGDEKKVMSTISVTGKEQVMLRVRVAEVQRQVLKQFGINIQAMFNIGDFAFNLSNINPFSAGQGLLSPSGGYAGNYTNGSTDIDAVIRAMERDGLLRTLAEPTLTAISGETAKFIAGGEFPVPIQDDDGITIEYKQFGVGLGFTPVVLSEGRISVAVNTEVSELDSTISTTTCSTCAAVPGLSVRRAETTLELPSGGSMMLAGLIKDTTRQNIDGTPGLKSLPILGALFRSRDFIQNQTEMVVIVTPYVVDAVNERQLTAPTDNLSIATDSQTILLGRLTRIYGVPGTRPQGVYHGKVGYIVE
jgi:pilus assembly protein CpaC